MEKAFKFRIYPNQEQKIYLANNFGCVRLVYNHYLDLRKTKWETEKLTFNYYDCCKDLNIFKEQNLFLKDIDSISLQTAIKNLDRAYTNFFQKRSGYPKFKSKKSHRYSYTTKNVNNNIKYLENYIKLPKLGKVKFKGNLIPTGKILNATIVQYPSGKYYVSLACSCPDVDKLPKTGRNIGIDLGLKEFAILSDGTKYLNPKYLSKSLERLAKLQRDLSRKSSEGSNHEKARIKVAKLYDYIKNQRNDFLQKLTTELIRSCDIICLEDLNVKGMMKNHHLARAISDVGWYEFVRMLTYKAEWYGKVISQIDPFYPSSQTCSICGEKSSITKDLSVREWTCPHCHSTLDRDINAAQNILKQGLLKLGVVA